MNIDGKNVELKAVEMPNLDRGEGVNVPGYGRMKPAPIQTRGNLQLLKNGGKTKRGNVKKYNEGSSVYADDKSPARGAIGIKEIKDPDIFTPKGKLSSMPIDESPKLGRMPIPLSNIKDPSNYSRAFPAKKRGGKVKK
jgi:hypothetical protein